MTRGYLHCLCRRRQLFLYPSFIIVAKDWASRLRKGPRCAINLDTRLYRDMSEEFVAAQRAVLYREGRICRR